MPKGKSKKFIDKKNSVTFHLVHRSQKDPLAADETAPQRVLVPVEEGQHSKEEKKPVDLKKRKEEQQKYGIFFDDEYDYLQHLKDVNTLPVEWERVENANQTGKDEKKNAPKINLPSSVFASSVEEEVGLLNKAAPVSGLRLDYDPDIVAAMDDDFNYDDPDNMLEDNFFELANAGGSDVPFNEEDEDDSEFEDEDNASDVSSGNMAVSDEERDEVGSLNGPQYSFRDEETKSRFTEYSMSSSVMRRNEQLTLLDGKFERLYAGYDENEIGPLDCEEIEGYVAPDSEIMLQYAKEFEALQREPTTQKMSFTKKNIFDLLKGHLKKDNNVLIHLLEEHLTSQNERTFLFSNECKASLRKLFYKMRTKWEACNRTLDRFMEENQSWLDENFQFTEALPAEPAPSAPAPAEPAPVPSSDPSKDAFPSTSSQVRGRPSSSFEESSYRTKRRRTQALRDQFTPNELAYATQMSLRASGQIDAAKIVKDIGELATASKYRSSLAEVRETPYTKEEALSLLIENKIAKAAYNNLRASSIRNNCKLYPSYKQILVAKKECYPPTTEYTITETYSEIKFQALLDLTVKRILAVQNEVIQNLSADDISNMQLICKWGCDGTSGQSTFKQRFDNDNDGVMTDSNIFFISLVPLRLISVNDSVEKETIIWKNPRPSSLRFCRPIKVAFMRETVESTKAEVAKIEEQEKNLDSYETIVDGKEVSVSFKLSMTMIDEKVCNSLTNTTSAMRCYLCNCTSKQFNDLDLVLSKPINDDHLKFGISVLHAKIRFFECLLYISYKLDSKKWTKRGSEEEKEALKKQKENIQKGFRQQLGLLIDQPKQGFGSSNDGKTARRFFENAKVSAAITSINENLLKRFHVILQALGSGFKINIPKFEEYALGTARLLVELYPWFYMPTTVHKLLIHDAKIIQSSLLPIGQMSEEAQESCNKFIKQYRMNFARKTSRTENMQDIFLRLLVASDPLISSVRKLPCKPLRSLDLEARELIVSEHVDPQPFSGVVCDSSSDESFHSDDDEY